MAFLNVTIPSGGVYEGYATNFTNHCVVIPLSISANDSIIFDDNISTSIPLYSGVIFEYDSPATFLNFKISGTAGDTFLLWFDNNSDDTGPHYIITSGANLNANITNGSLNVSGNVNVTNSSLNVNVTNSTLNTNANITNSVLNTNANITNSSINANITNSTLNTNANITNSSLTTTVSGTVNENISGQSVTVYQSENLISGSFVYATPVTINMTNSGAYVALQLTIAPGDQIIINAFTLVGAQFTNNPASNWYTGSAYILPTESEWGGLQQGYSVIPAGSSIPVKVGGWSAVFGNSGSSMISSSAAVAPAASFVASMTSWEGRLYLNNTTSSNQIFYFGIIHSGNSGEHNINAGYTLALDYQGLGLSGSSIQGIYSQGSGGSSGSGGSGGGGGHKLPY